MDKLAQAYDKIERGFQNSYINGLLNLEPSNDHTSVTVTLDKDHKPPYQYDIFVSWVHTTISLLAFCLGLDNNKEVGGNVLEMICNIHCPSVSVDNVQVRYNYVQHIVESMQEQLLMIKQSTTTRKMKTLGSQVTCATFFQQSITQYLRLRTTSLILWSISLMRKPKRNQRLQVQYMSGHIR